jgi:hypothetical protein
MKTTNAHIPRIPNAAVRPYARLNDVDPFESAATSAISCAASSNRTVGTNAGRISVQVRTENTRFVSCIMH